MIWEETFKLIVKEKVIPKEEVVDTELGSYVKEMIEKRTIAKKNKDYDWLQRIIWI